MPDAPATPTPAATTAPRPPVRSVARVFSIEDLRRQARRRLPRAVFDLFDGGAEDEVTMRGNRVAFERVRLMPRVLVDVARVDTATRILGAPSALPIAIAPTGAVGFGRHGGDCMIARAAQHYGIPYSLSSSGTASIERIAGEAPRARRWFQAYILKKREFTMHLIQRAAQAGYEGLIITVDLPVGGKRERDYRNDFAVPFRFSARNLLDFASRPAWAWPMLTRGMPVMENLLGLSTDAVDSAGIASSVGRNYDPSFDWDALAGIRDAWRGKLLVKGIVHPDDARRAVAIGADAVVVSNHGGRQLDGGIATLDALPGVVDAVGGKVSVLVDGGVRRGVDVLKAVALGAEAVLVGRPMLYGVAAAGEDGALRALEILRSELVRAMQLCGVASVRQIGRELIAA